MKLLNKGEKISIDELKSMSEKIFGELVKAVVDVENEIMVVDADLHADEEKFLLNRGSNQSNLWGINLYPDDYGDIDEFIEFDSMINLRPSWGNMTRGVDDVKIQEKIIEIVKNFIEK